MVCAGGEKIICTFYLKNSNISKNKLLQYKINNKDLYFILKICLRNVKKSSELNSILSMSRMWFRKTNTPQSLTGVLLFIYNITWSRSELDCI